MRRVEEVVATLWPALERVSVKSSAVDTRLTLAGRRVRGGPMWGLRGAYTACGTCVMCDVS